MPLWLALKSSDPHGDVLRVIFKSGDDLRADILILHLFRIMNSVREDGGQQADPTSSTRSLGFAHSRNVLAMIQLYSCGKRLASTCK